MRLNSKEATNHWEDDENNGDRIEQSLCYGPVPCCHDQHDEDQPSYHRRRFLHDALAFMTAVHAFYLLSLAHSYL